jgi:hypothetical protein
MAVIEGWKGRATFNGINMEFEKWKVTVDSPAVPANSFESRNRRQGHSLIGATVTGSGYFDDVTDHFANTGAKLRPGQTLVAQCYLVKLPAFFFMFPALTIHKLSVGNELEGRVQVEIEEALSFGDFYYPGNISSLLAG